MRTAAPLLLALLCAPSFAQNYEIQVYPGQTVEKGRTFVELHSNTAFRGPPDGPGALQPDEGAYHETLELTRGFTSWFETGFYTFTSARSGEGWDYAGTHLRPRVAAPKEWGWPVGASLSVEGGYFKPRFAETRWDVEIRPIVDWRRGPFYVSVNPALERALVLYDGGSTSFQFAPAAKLAWDVTQVLTLGLEYYGALGPVEKVSPGREQQHQLYPAVDLNVSPDWELNAGLGFGLTRATDKLVLKLIVGRRL